MAVHRPPTLLLTRPKAASERFVEGLRGFDVVIAPLMEIVGMDATIDLNGVTGLILTSEKAVRFVPPSDLPAYCVGPRTAEAAAAVGLRSEVIGPDADALVTELLRLKPSGTLLHVHGAHTRGNVVGRLTDGGIATRGVAAYEQRSLPADGRFRDAVSRPNVIVPLFSPRSAKLFAAAVEQTTENMTVLAISDAARDALPSALRHKTRVVSRPDGAEMRKALETYGMRRNSP